MTRVKAGEGQREDENIPKSRNRPLSSSSNPSLYLCQCISFGQQVTLTQGCLAGLDSNVGLCLFRTASGTNRESLTMSENLYNACIPPSGPSVGCHICVFG